MSAIFLLTNTGIGDEILRVAPAGRPQQVQMVAEPVGVVDELADGDRHAEVRELWHVLADRIVQRQLSLLRKQRHRSGSELLGDRRDVEHGGRRVRDAVVEIGHAVATLERELLNRRRFKSQAEAKMAVFERIEGWHNPHRRHSSLGYRSPVNYERVDDQSRLRQALLPAYGGQAPLVGYDG